MTINYLKIGLRNLFKYKGVSFINISGLAIGISCCIFIFLYLSEHLSYDKYHRDFERIYRVALNLKNESKEVKYAFNVPPLAPNLKKDFPEVEISARIFAFNQTRIVNKNDKVFYENGFVYADPDIFNILNFRFIAGDKNNALSNPKSIVLPERLINKYFENDNALGKTININNSDFIITGIIENVPENTHMSYDIFVSIEDLRNPPWMEDWTWPGMYTYIKVKENINAVGFEEKVSSYNEKFLKGKLKSSGQSFKNILQPIKDIHLNSNLEYEIAPPGSKENLIIFLFIGLMILLLACVNYINLSTARAGIRAKEIGIRKANGANKIEIIKQFIIESLLIAFISGCFTLLIIEILRPIFISLTGIEISAGMIFKPKIFLSISFLILIIGIGAGVYPAFVLSSFKPVGIIKNTGNNPASKQNLRKVLVIVQFAISFILCVGTIINYQQLNYMQTKDIGFEKENKLIISLNGNLPSTADPELVKNSFLEDNSVLSVCFSERAPGEGAPSFQTSLAYKLDSRMIYYCYCDFDFLKVYKIQLLSGRGFDKNIKSDIEESCLINGSALKSFGWVSAEDAIGKQIKTGLKGKIKNVIGVIRDFNYKGAQYKVDPLILEIYPEMIVNTLTLNIKNDNPAKTVQFVANKWKKLMPDVPLEYYFLDTELDKQFKSEDLLKKIITVFTLLGIFISSLGLFGLASFMTQKRTKEIGIRKILGSSVQSLIYLMIKEYIKWITYAVIIAAPVAYFIGDIWLNNFVVRITLTPVPFLLAFGISFMISFITVGFISFRAIMETPIKSIKYE